jgi:hypothetical protein
MADPLLSAELTALGLDPTQSADVLIAEIKNEARALVQEGRQAARGIARAHSVIRDLQQRLSEPYVFKIFPEYTVAYGLLYTFRQKWVPGDFQVGHLVATVPLAPRESRKIQKKLVVRESRQAKELRKSVRNLVNENTSTNTVTSEVAKRAEASTTTNMTADGSYGNDEIYQIKGQLSSGRDAKKLSEETKKSIRQNTLKAAQEIREERQIEIETTSDTTTDATTSGEISNPNDEIAVTYLYYELQRQYQVSEQLHRITPIIFVANPFPNPADIDRDWLIEHEWILRRVILDDSFLPVFDLLKTSKEGEQLSLRVLEAGVATAFRAVSETRDYIATQERLKDAASKRLDEAVARLANVQAGEESEGVIENLHEWLFGSSRAESEDAAGTRRESAENVFARIEEGMAAARNRLSQLESTMESATREYVQAVRHFTDSIQQIFALRIHIKQNITYYMQAIWKHEYRDQRYFRLFDKAVPFVTIDAAAVMVLVDAAGAVTIQLPAPPASTSMRLDEIADIDNLLGFKGNYMMFPLKEPCYKTTEMMAGFLNAELELVDPDASSTGVSLAELREAEAELTRMMAPLALANPKDPNVSRYQEEIKKIQIVASAMDNDSSLAKEEETVIVPSDMLYIEALPGSHPIMENFKLTHRRLDAEEARERVKSAAINNLRMEALLLSGSFIDPDIDKQIFIKSDVPVVGTFGATETGGSGGSSGSSSGGR